MAMQIYAAFRKASASLEPHYQIVYFHFQDPRRIGALPLCRGAVGLFYSPCWLGNFLYLDSVLILHGLVTNIFSTNRFFFIKFSWKYNPDIFDIEK